MGDEVKEIPEENEGKPGAEDAGFADIDEDGPAPVLEPFAQLGHAHLRHGWSVGSVTRLLGHRLFTSHAIARKHSCFHDSTKGAKQ